MKLKRTRPTTPRSSNAVAKGYRSGFEERIAQELLEKNVPFTFESEVIRYLKPAKVSRYTPDFKLSNGIIIETKGRFLVADRQKHLLIKEQHPDIDIRFVFSNPNARISKKSSTTYADWCEKHGFMYAKGSIPNEWMQ